MLTFSATKPVELCNGLTRRDFLRVGAASAAAVGLTLADLAELRALGSENRGDVNCILLFLVGGPSHLDTWDPKPGAPEEVRGPFRPISTNVPGMLIGEHFPRMARMADRFSLVRSVHHDSAPIHETGHQLMQTGRLFRSGQEFPHYGAALSFLKGRKDPELPPFVVLPGPVGNTGVSIGHGQTAGFLGADHEPVFFDPRESLDPARSNPEALVRAVDLAQGCVDDALSRGADPTPLAYDSVFSSRAKKAFRLDQERDDVRTAYGWHTFGQSCLLARRLVEHGVRLVTVNMFDTVFNEITWDCHADGGSLAVTLDDYKNTLCPMFDRAYSSLLEDLRQRGLLDTTLVLAMGEFGRTPHLNPRGGRDHWPGCWTVLLAGGGVRGGRVVGSSDAIGAEPKDRPVTPAEIAATVYQALGLDRNARLPGPNGTSVYLCDAPPIRELF